MKLVKSDTLYKTTRKLLRERPSTLTYEEIALSIKQSKNWVEKFSQGKIKNPSVNAVQALYEFLTGSDLQV